MKLGVLMFATDYAIRPDELARACCRCWISMPHSSPNLLSIPKKTLWKRDLS